MVNDKLIGSGYLSNTGTLSGDFLANLAAQNRARRLAKYPELCYLEVATAAVAPAALDYKIKRVK